MEENKDENENNGKRGRGRPSGAPNRLKNVNKIVLNRQMASGEVKRLVNLFVIKKFQKIDELYETLDTRSQAKMLTELMRYSTPIAGREEDLLDKKNEKKQITEIKISYETPMQLEENKPLEITPHQDIDIDDNGDDIEEDDNIDFQDDEDDE
ncbi:hypothetical protein GEO21_22375 [Sphingobacterium faecium]|uniref:hypothetical protein n=1 Tax=Sphingobacterium faecium TaxID=34087 RepID=UPI0012927A3B|nr:hypothetical protein [Sphingobacterium faecium]MQP30234.1 hypothetical protein [Sphingobacterium faecium]